jgi:hypothetical protein
MPRRNNNDPAPVLAPLPGEQYEENLLDVVTDPGLQSPMDFETGYDRINGLDASRDVPQQVVEDSYNMPETEVRRATPALQNEGSFFDLSYINDFRAAYQQALQQTGDPAKAVEMVRPIAQSWTPAQRHVYERTEGYAEVDPKYAAGLVQDWYKQQESVQAQQQSPQAKALDARSLADAQRTMQRADNMIFLMDNLRGGPRGGDKKDQGVKKGEEKWRSRVGSIQGRWPSMLSDDTTLGWNADFASLKGIINLDEAVRNAGQGSLSDGERVLMAQAASLGLEQARDEQGFERAFERMYDLALETRDKAQAKLSSGKETPSAQPATESGNAPQASPAAAPGFQVGKLYRDANGRKTRFQGYDNQGNPVFISAQ